MRSLLALVLVVSLQSCTCVIEELKFDLAVLPTAILNQEYSAIITASITNNALDDSFAYSFDFSGNLPEGLALTTDTENRRVIIQGTPIESGVFDFIIKAEAKPSIDSDDQSADDVFLIGLGEALVCDNNYKHEQAYTLTVSIM